MLISKKHRKQKFRADWFDDGRKLHCDVTLPRDIAEAFVKDKLAIANHNFLPLISFKKIERRFRNEAGGKTRARIKKRPLAYVSNKDGYVYSYYASILNSYLDEHLVQNELDSSVIGYRKNLSNISLAGAAFDEIAHRGACTAIAYDIKSFFDNIDHQVLKNCWKHVIGLESLPSDHYRVFRGLTQSRSVDRESCLIRLGYKKSAKNNELPSRLCLPDAFRRKICIGTPAQPSLLSPSKSVGIPQGTPISAVAANVAMIFFDKHMNDFAKKIAGSYRRYSDDILIICPTNHVKNVEREIIEALEIKTKTLTFSTEKTIRVDFLGQDSSSSGRLLQYLGFTFDGRKKLIRAGTLSRFYARMARGVAWVKLQKKLVEKGKIAGRSEVHRRELHARFHHLGKQTFVTGYAKTASQKIGLGNGIRKQIARHPKILENMIRTDKRRLKKKNVK